MCSVVHALFAHLATWAVCLSHLTASSLGADCRRLFMWDGESTGGSVAGVPRKPNYDHGSAPTPPPTYRPVSE